MGVMHASGAVFYRLRLRFFGGFFRMSSVMVCPYDGLPCDRLVEDLIGDLTFGACYVKGLDGKLLFVCPRFVAKSGVSVSEDLVRKELIPK